MGPHLTKYGLRRGLLPYYSIPSGILIYPAVWQQYTWAEKWGAAVLFFWGGGPRVTQCRSGRGLSGIFIDRAVWRERTWAENWGRGLCPLWDWVPI